MGDRVLRISDFFTFYYPKGRMKGIVSIGKENDYDMVEGGIYTENKILTPDL